MMLNKSQSGQKDWHHCDINGKEFPVQECEKILKIKLTNDDLYTIMVCGSFLFYEESDV